MTTRIVGAFADPSKVHGVVQALIDHGVSQQAISVVMNAPGQAAGSQENAAQATGAAVGSGVLAGLGLTSLLVPYLGPLLAAGPFAAALGVAGSANAKHAEAVDKMETVLEDNGLAREQAAAYAQRLSEGNTIVAVDIDDSQTSPIADIFHAHGGAGLDFRPVS